VRVKRVVFQTFPMGRGRDYEASVTPPGAVQGKKALSALEIRVDDLGQVFNCQSPRVSGSVDEKGRG
jgi:hypothetical protein